MPLATLSDVQAALRAMGKSELADSLDEPTVAELLDEASDLVTGYLYPTEVPDPTPRAIVRVVAAMACAVLTRPANLLPETAALNADIYGVTLTPGSTSWGPYLTAALKLRLKPFRRGMVSVPMGSERY